MKPPCTPKALVVDDEQDIRRLVRTVAEEIGFEVGEASSVQEFRDLYSDEVSLNVIVIDIVMPTEHGTGLFEFLQSHHINSAIVVITGYNEVFLEGALRLGEQRGLNMVGGMEKPLDLEVLRGHLKKAFF